MHDFRFASWNLNGRKRPSGHATLLRSLRCDLAALQEVTVAHHEAMVASGLFDWAAFSLDRRPAVQGEGGHRRLGCALYGRAPLRLRGFELIPSLPFPEKALAAAVSFHDCELTCCSFHVPPGASHGRLKVDTMRELAAYLARKPSRTIVGIDGNTPKRERWNIEENEWWRDGESLLLGPQPRHGLQDAFRLVLAREPAYRRFLQRCSPEGPLDVSFVRGHGSRSARCRYDFIYVTPDIEPLFVQYRYSDALLAGSDHAIVIADLRTDEGADLPK